ncbi:hypothetical protein F0562_018224 [Nyssa sinensis]|uniref:Uncharacterized protein n=1 Tax=Nyssa sinensis TaxID=561372 RepID=A0A5J4ZAL3_9ASTE|nr:hypothetical protein F0562_018224 [Nyssa sinensis]
MSTVSLCSAHPFSLYNKQSLSLKSPSHQSGLLHLAQNSSYLRFNPLRVTINSKDVMKKTRRGFGPVCYSAAPLSPRNLQWICTISSAVLMLARGTAIQKSFIVPFFALQAPAGIISWIKGEYGIWTAFLALLVRLFFFIPGELELPFVALLLVIVAPYQVMNLRGTQEGVISSLVIAGYLAFQHFSRAGSLRKAFDQGSIVATLAIICILAVPCLLLF